MDNDIRDRFRRASSVPVPPRRPVDHAPVFRFKPAAPAPTPGLAQTSRSQSTVQPLKHSPHAGPAVVPAQPFPSQTAPPQRKHSERMQPGPAKNPPRNSFVPTDPSISLRGARSLAEETIIPKRAEKPRRTRRRKLGGQKKLFAIPVALVAAAVLLFWPRHNEVKAPSVAVNNQQPAVESATTEVKPKGTIRLIATGDNFTFDSVNNAAKKPDGSYDYLPMYTAVKPFFDKSDVKICNESVPTGGTLAGISGFPNFNAPPAFAKGLGDLGCNVINMATAHMNDKGQAAVDATVSYWDKQPELLAIAGANRSAEEQANIRYFTIKSVKFAYLAYTTTTNNAQITPHGVNIYSDALAGQQVAEARKNAEFVIVSMNWGTENSNDIDSNQEHIAQGLADLNADLILGVGSHVLQPVKVLTSQDKQHQTLVWFSLGNFLNSQVPVDNLIGGIAVMDIDIPTQNIVDPKFLPVYMHYEWTAEQKQRQSTADLQARHDLRLLPLDLAAEALAKSQNNTTVQAQTDRVKAIMTKFAPLKIITSAEF